MKTIKAKIEKIIVDIPNNQISNLKSEYILKTVDKYSFILAVYHNETCIGWYKPKFDGGL